MKYFYSFMVGFIISVLGITAIVAGFGYTFDVVVWKIILGQSLFTGCICTVVSWCVGLDE